MTDQLRDSYDQMLTHDDPCSPYYDGPIVGDDCCEHGVLYEEDCQECEIETDEEINL
jgi:hypothetical protein